MSSIPCEAFVEIGLELKRSSPFAGTFTLGLANGYYGVAEAAWHGLKGLGTSVRRYQQ